METLKKFFPYSFAVKKGDVKDLVIRVVVYFLASIVAGIVLGVLAFIPIVGWIVTVLVSPLVGLYALAGIVFTFLEYFSVFDKK